MPLFQAASQLFGDEDLGPMDPWQDIKLRIFILFLFEDFDVIRVKLFRSPLLVCFNGQDEI